VLARTWRSALERCAEEVHQPRPRRSVGLASRSVAACPPPAGDGPGHAGCRCEKLCPEWRLPVRAIDVTHRPLRAQQEAACAFASRWKSATAWRVSSPFVGRPLRKARSNCVIGAVTTISHQWWLGMHRCR